jgi:hypothetical protein
MFLSASISGRIAAGFNTGWVLQDSIIDNLFAPTDSLYAFAAQANANTARNIMTIFVALQLFRSAAFHFEGTGECTLLDVDGTWLLIDAPGVEDTVDVADGVVEGCACCVAAIGRDVSGIESDEASK